MKKFTKSIRKPVQFILFAALLLACTAGFLCACAEAEDRDLIVPDADTRCYTAADISDMPLQVVNYAKNEIYARHGRLFDSAELTGYFSQQPWYSGTIKADDFTDQVFNEYEKANILLLNDREMALSPGGYALDQPGYNYDAVEEYIASRFGTVQAEAFLMRLRKIIGTVVLKDSEGESLDVEENMRLFSESVLGTKTESGAIVDLDEEKLAILDERSRAALEKNDDGSRLVIRLRKGELYFSVDEPLAEDESFDITFSDLRLAIRGTSGVVTIEDSQTSSVILASGHAMIYERGRQTGTAQGTEIQAGERVRIMSDGTGRKTFEKETLSEEDLPPFLTECLRQDPDAVPKVLADTGWTGDSFAGSGDRSAFDSRTPGETSQPTEPDAAGGEEPLPEDGNRIVLTGTLNEYSYDEVVAMAGNYPANDAERQLHPTYWLMILDEPQIIGIVSGGSPEIVSGEASMIWISEPAGLEQYAGQHLTFSIDPQNTWWPSDVSLPLNEPRTSDVNILS